MFRCVKTCVLSGNLTLKLSGYVDVRVQAKLLSMAFLYAGRCTSENRLDNKTAIITGCNVGIGKLNALDFYRRGCRVIMACRDVSKAEAAAEDIKKQSENCEQTGTIVVKKLDLTSMSSVRECAKEILEQESQIHLLINNAGVMFCPKTETEDGFELHMGTNHFGHFLFTLLLLPLIKKSAPARIVNVSSAAHRSGSNNYDDLHWKTRPYSSFTAYAESKLANIYFTTELGRRLQGSGVNVYAVHPGVVRTELGRHLNTALRQLLRFTIGPFFKSPEQGAQTQIYCAVADEATEQTGLYYVDCRPAQPCANALDKEAAKKLFELSAEIVGFDLNQLA